jgi:MFS family permease
LVGIAGYVLRRHVLETGATEKRTRAPIVETLHDHWRVVAGFAGLTVFTAVTFYVGFVYLVSWLQTADGIPPSRSLEINTFSMLMVLPVLIAAGWLSDRIGRKPLMFVASMGGLIPRPAPVLVVKPSLGGACPAWAAWPCIAAWALLWGIARPSGRGCASDGALHRGIAGL